jgi:adenylate cyclase
VKVKNKRRWKIIKEYCIGWTVAFIFLSIVRGEGTTEMGAVQFGFWKSVIFSIIIGIIFGSISGFTQIVTEEKIYKKISMHQLLIFRLTYALLFLLSLILVSYFLVTTFFGVEIGLIEFFIEPGSFAIYIFILSVDFFLFILRFVNLMLGESNLKKLIQGKFYIPREEDRVFMFLDLKSSTQLAEKLGHIQYSRLIQDCFDDLGVVVENEAEIYQYVGDEVILTWELREGIRNQNCINAFYNFKKQLFKKKEYYLRKYDCQPFFKAGINAGTITVTEVGRYKKEIAYHGDTINTAARIQAKCNELDQELLISEDLKKMLNSNGFDFNIIGSVQLKGKENEISIFSVSKVVSSS